MKRKKGVAFASLLMILLASLALITPVSSTDESHIYWVMSINRKIPGNVVIIDSLMENPIEEGYWNFTIFPWRSSQNITFSDPWELSGVGWIVNLTVPATDYVGISYTSWSKVPPMWFRFSTSMSEDGYGWIFLNATGDVDCHTFSNNTAAYWHSSSPKAGEKAADHGSLPSPGPDGVAGTHDDGFGDGTNDTRGSSILILPTNMSAEYFVVNQWVPLFTFSWPQVFTTGDASTIVIEPDGGPGAKLLSQIDGANQTVVGQPWEFFAGLDHSSLEPGYENVPVPWGHPKCNAYVTYVTAWSILDIDTVLGDYDICFTIQEKKVREDVVIADIDCTELVDVMDLTIASLSLWGEAQGPGPDGEYDTPDDKKQPDPKYDARADVADPPGLIDVVDLTVISLELWDDITP